MNYSSISVNNVVRNQLRVDNPTVIMLVTDNPSAINLLPTIYNSGILLTNCDGVVVPNKMFNIGRKRFNGKLHYLDVKKQLVKQDDGGSKKLKILATMPGARSKTKTTLTSSVVSKEQEENRFFFYDASMLSEAIVSLQENFPPKLLAHIVFSELTEMYNEIKRTRPLYNVDPMFFISNEISPLFQIFHNFKGLFQEKEISQFNFFDNYVLLNSGNKTFIPILYKDNANPKLNITMLNRLSGFIQTTQKVEQIQQEPAVDVTKSDVLPIKDKPESTFLQNIIQDLGQKKLMANIIDDEMKIEVDPKDLSKVLKKYKIDNPDIVSNVKSSLDTYIQHKGEKLTQDEAETIVLKAINFTVHGNEEISEDYLAKPQLLFNKLNEIKTYQVPLNFPKLKSLSINPTDIIDIKHTCGQNRQKFEFTEMIHTNVSKLFSSIESVNEHPIKVKKIEHEVKDNDSDRFISYKVTLQNMTGINKEPYTVELKVPAPVNDRYFKLRGNHYIMATQQFFRPITKTDRNEVRLLTNYAMVRVGIKNLKFNPSDINDIISYVKVKYPKLIKELTDKYLIFNDSSVIYLDGNLIYTDPKGTIVSVDEITNRLVDSAGNELKYGKYEYLYQIISHKILQADPNDKLTKTKLSIPYLEVHMGGIKLPLILYFWSQKGLLDTLNDFGIDYKIEDNPSGQITVPTKNNQFLNIFPKSLRESLLVNGILAGRVKSTINDLTNKEEIYDHIAQNYGSRSIVLFNLITENLIDPITKELLQFDNLPTNVPALLSGKVLDVLFNKKQDSLADLKIYRARLSEMVMQAMYKLIKLSHNHYRSKIEFGDEHAQIVIDPDYIITGLLGEIGVLHNTEPVNPVDEIMLASKVIKTGKGGEFRLV
jgi:hypothetical protein